MAFLDELPLDVLLAVVKWLHRKYLYEPVFRRLLPLASVNTSLRRPLLPLLYKDLVSEFRFAVKRRPRHNASLAMSAGCSEYAQRVVEDEDSEGEAPCSCSDVIKQLDKELPKLRQESPVTCDVLSGTTPLAYSPPSVSFLTQLTSLYLDCANQGIDTNRLPQLFAPTLVDLTLYGVNPEDIWSAFYDGNENQTVVFARLKRLAIRFENPLYWGQNSDLPPHLQGATQGMLTKRSVWTAGAASGEPGCRVPLFPVLRTLWCENMTYGFHDFVSRTQCHKSLVSLYVGNEYVYFDFDAELFKNLETVVFNTRFWGKNEEGTGSVDLYTSAFTNLLRTKTNMQRMLFRSTVRDTIFQVPPNIGCTNLCSLFLGVEVDFKSMLRLLSSLKHLVELELCGDRESTYRFDDGRVDTAEDVDELQLPQTHCPPVSSTLRRFTCYLHTSRERRCYTACYAFELALHFPALENMTLGVLRQTGVSFYKTLLDRFIERLSGSPYMNDGLLNAKVAPLVNHMANSLLLRWRDRVPHCWEH